MATAPPSTAVGQPVLPKDPDSVLAAPNRTQQHQDPTALKSAQEVVPSTYAGDAIFAEDFQEPNDRTAHDTDDILDQGNPVGELSLPGELIAPLPPLPLVSPISPTPLSPTSKMGHVLHQATENVDHLMRGVTPLSQKTPKQLQHIKQGKQKRDRNAQSQEAGRPAASAAQSGWGDITADSTTTTDFNTAATSTQAKVEWKKAQVALKEAEKSLRGLPLAERRQFELNAVAQALPVRRSEISETVTLVEVQNSMAEGTLERIKTIQDAAKNIKKQAKDGVSIDTVEVRAKAAAQAAGAEWRQAQREEADFVTTLRAQHA